MSRAVPSDRALVAVRWNDAHASSAEFVDDSNMESRHAPVQVVTVGWLMRDDPAGVSVCAEYVTDMGYRGHTFIPRGMVDRVVTLRRGPKQESE